MDTLSDTGMTFEMDLSDLNAFDELMATWEMDEEQKELKIRVKEETNSTSTSPASPSGSMPTSPGFEHMEDMFLDEAGMGIHLGPDEDALPDSQLQELMYIAQQCETSQSSQTDTSEGLVIEDEVFVIPVLNEEGIIPNLEVLQETPKKERVSIRHQVTISRQHVSSSGRKSRFMSDDELVTYSVKDLNRVLQGYAHDEAKKLKRRRRTLKNRGYAANSREKRNTVKSELETTNLVLSNEVCVLQHQAGEVSDLQIEVNSLKAELARIKRERDQYKNERDLLLTHTLGPASPLV